MSRTPFKLSSGKTTPFKEMGSSPAKHDIGYGEHVHKKGSPTGDESTEVTPTAEQDKGSYSYSSGTSQEDKFVKQTPKIETVGVDESKTELVDPEKMIIVADTGEKKSQSSRPEGPGPVTEEPSPDDPKKSKPKGGGKPSQKEEKKSKKLLG